MIPEAYHFITTLLGGGSFCTLQGLLGGTWDLCHVTSLELCVDAHHDLLEHVGKVCLHHAVISDPTVSQYELQQQNVQRYNCQQRTCLAIAEQRGNMVLLSVSMDLSKTENSGSAVIPAGSSLPRLVELRVNNSKIASVR